MVEIDRVHDRGGGGEGEEKEAERSREEEEAERLELVEKGGGVRRKSKVHKSKIRNSSNSSYIV